ncbi:cache domain-containing sensor histidine kinase [Paenibacillus antri]|uniref:cache domain-containing sensor histidine kinase n=1 Tax=Paenibacillus antri TaxID=2582848 RepID=UPI0013052A58|nr:sensor histidine kinase [Paenibacillus antri]
MLNSLRKWLLLYVLAIVAPASVLLYSYYQRSASVLEEELSRSALQTLAQAGINLSYRIRHIEDASNALLMNPNLAEYLEQAGEDPSEGRLLDNVKDLRSLVEQTQANTDVYRVRFFVDGKKVIASERVNFFPIEQLQSDPWYPKIVEGNGKIVWSGLYEETFIDNGAALLFTNARIIRDPKRYDTIYGILMLDVAERTFSEILTPLELPGDSKLYLADGDGRIVWHRDRTLVGTAGSPAADGLTKSGETYSISTRVEGTDWRLVAEIPASAIAKRALEQGRTSSFVTILGISALFLALMFLLLALMIRSMNRRLQLVISTIRKEGVERIDEATASGGDFVLLERSVDRLIYRVKSLMEQTYRAEVQRREAELKALQAQINPHFLYNTLDTINWIAIGRNATDISQMIDGLAKYFRLSLNKGRDLTSVADELQLAEVYLDLQKTRFPSSFEYEIELAEEAAKYYIPKLTLQPIVENALLHGIRKSKAKSGVIRIRARKEGDALTLEVEDDGIGMDEERARRLLVEPTRESKPDEGGSSYGLYNVNERIKLFAGPDYGLSIRSRPNEGTTVTVRLKAISENLWDSTRN